ncbi:MULTISPECIES: rRNA adenine N-6-methyltransferase family protein [unclassified Devosia]|uniref:protein-L-isoaspartate O-methyltransferase family protein n=1 Tax=unclassified Devosia TaxID=196773 RepID=UPI000FDB47C1|nr:MULTISPECIES: rRNA adenine N-6-methyltransferase family protein [unclassified Devosia]
MSTTDLEIVRRGYARQVTALLGARNERLEAAFAAVPRERFLGSDPWYIVKRAQGFVRLPANDPVYVYQDVLIALDEERGINNGSPSLHASMLDALAPKLGDTVAHIGAGTGYYSAILAELVGATGRVVAVEFDHNLAQQAHSHLADRPNVEVITGDGGDWPREDVEGVYVNFAVERPAEPWIDRLKMGGRLVFPLGVASPAKPNGARFAQGVALRVEKASGLHPASIISPVSFIFAEGAAGTPDPGLVQAFKDGGVELVRSLAWHQEVDPARCWHVGAGWALCYGGVAQGLGPEGSAR